jgi:predicted alpha-1,2-mannosidase
MMETNETGTFYYSGFDNKVHKGDHAYTGYSIWDTFRAEWGFINLFAPERVNGMVQSMLQAFEQSGRLPMWQNIVETNIMIGTHSSSLIAEALAKGFKGFDLEVAWKAIWKDAMVPPKNDLTCTYADREEGTDLEARAGLTKFFDLGYVPVVLTSEASSRTLEYAYDDYTVAVAANLTGHPEWSQYFLNRSKSYRNLWNPETQFMGAKYENGTWCEQWCDATPKSAWTEASNWVYTFNVQHDFAGLRDLFKGAENLNSKLDAYYEGGWNDQTNEPSHATVFAYLYANNPSKAQALIRSLLKDNYFNSPTGLSGNDDCGQMSAWYIFNSMGFYPVNPSSAEYIIGTPLFDKIEIKFPQSDAVLTIVGDGAAAKPYVESVSLDQKDLVKPVLSHADLLSASSLVFKLSSSPADWGKNTL